MNRTFSESLRFPAPDKPVRIVLKKRDARNVFRDIWTFTVDPADKFIARGAAAPDAGPLIKLHERGDPATKLDLLILGDGYTAARARQVRARRQAADGDLARDVAVQGARSATSTSGGSCRRRRSPGISRPSQDIYRRTPIGAIYDAFDSERYMLTFENHAFRDIAANAPYDVGRDPDQQRDLRRRRHLRSVQHRRGRQRLGAVHLRPRVRPSHRRPGRRVLHLRRRLSAGCRSRRAVGAERHGAARSVGVEVEGSRDPGTPIPTPWPKEEFEAYTKEIQQKRRAIRAANRPESEMDALFRDEEKRDTTLLERGAACR